MKRALLIALATLMAATTFASEYRATCIIRVLFPEDANTQYSADALHALTETQAKIIDTNPVLNTVIENLLLTLSSPELGLFSNKMTREQALAILRGHLAITLVPNTVGLISVQFTSPNPSEAARIANEIAGVYRDMSSKYEQQPRGLKVVLIDPAEPNSCTIVEKDKGAEQGVPPYGAQGAPPGER